MTMTDEELASIRRLGRSMRRRILEASYECGQSTHLGGGLSIVDVIATLYGAVLQYRSDDPEWRDRDRFILSKGHGVLGFFPALVEVGLLPLEEFATFMRNGSQLIAHPIMNTKLGIESSNGSLGQGLSMGVGLAWGANFQKFEIGVFVLVGDGECNEGAIWEAAAAAAHLGLTNLTVIVDLNGFQSDGKTTLVSGSTSMAEKWESFGWCVEEIDGHDVKNILTALRHKKCGKPRAIVAKTIKGKGVSFMENDNSWHHTRLTRDQYERAMQELDISNED